MKQIILKNKKPNNFIQNYLPYLFIKLVNSKLIQNKNTNIINYIEENYNISIADIIKLLNKNSLTYDYDENNLTIHLNQNLKFENGYRLETIVNLIDYGCLSCKGIHLFDDCVDYIISH